MLQQLFGSLSRAVEGYPAVALLAACGWGILSILLSPCHLASIPLIVGFINAQAALTIRRACVLSLLFASGILITIALIGAVSAGAGRMMGDVGRWGNYGVAIIFFAVGLFLLDVVRIPLPPAAVPGMARKGMLAAFVLGLVFGIALGPCTFAYMAPMLAVTFKVAATSMGYAVLLLLAYGAGHCGVIVCAGTFTELVQKFLRWNENSRGTLIVKRVCGVLVCAAGIYLIVTAH